MTLTRAIAAAVAAVLLVGCGYSQPGDYDRAPSQGLPARSDQQISAGNDQASPRGYQWHSLYREDVQTVAVPIFTTRDYARGLEFRLSKSVVNNLEAHSQYKVVSRERADTVLEGEIVRSEIQNLSHDYTTNVPQEQLVVTTVNFKWKDLRTGRILLERKNFIQTASYYPTAGENVWTGDQQAIERLALGIVQEMQADW